MVFAELVQHVALIDKEHPDGNAEEQHHPFHLHAHTHKHIHPYCPQHTEPCRAAVGEKETHHQQCHDGQGEQAAPPLAIAAEDEIKGGGDEEGDDTTVGGVVVVERLHDPVKGLEVAEIAKGFGGGDEDDCYQADGIAPEELTDAAFVAEYLSGGKEERHHKPKTRQPIFERHEWQLGGTGGEQHPHHGGQQAQRDRVPEQAEVVAAGGEHPEEEHQREEDHHRLHGHRELHLGHERHIDGKGGEQRHAEQPGFETGDEQQKHQPRQGNQRQIVEVLEEQDGIGHREH